MGFTSDQPPHGSAKSASKSASIDAAAPNVAMLKGDIDSGRTGDKNEVFDPGLAALGTDEEAAGTPITPTAVKLARRQESKWRWLWGPPATGTAHNTDDRGVLYGFVGLILLIGISILSGIVWLP